MISTPMSAMDMVTPTMPCDPVTLTPQLLCSTVAFILLIKLKVRGKEAKSFYVKIKFNSTL